MLWPWWRMCVENGRIFNEFHSCLLWDKSLLCLMFAGPSSQLLCKSLHGSHWMTDLNSAINWNNIILETVDYLFVFEKRTKHGISAECLQHGAPVAFFVVHICRKAPSSTQHSYSLPNNVFHQSDNSVIGFLHISK